MKHRIFLIAFFWLMQMSATFAHALWIETDTDGISGKVHEIKIYYGEYGLREFEPTDKWYSDVSTFTLWLVSPDGIKKQLSRN